MSSGLISDVLYDAGSAMWGIASAVVIVAACQAGLDVINKGYSTALNVEQRWETAISMATLRLIVSVVSVIGAAGFVLRTQWVEQMTSGLVVGLGFGLQATIQDVVTGFIRRRYDALMVHETVIEVHTTMGKVQGKITRMHLSTFELSKGDFTYVLPWTTLREFKILRKPIKFIGDL